MSNSDYCEKLGGGSLDHAGGEFIVFISGATSENSVMTGQMSWWIKAD